MITGCVLMVGPDVRMDQIGDDLFKVSNPLPVKCTHCTFPDIDFIPKVYKLTRGYSSSVEIAPAHLGNFLVVDRIKKILEVVCPNACEFRPTVDYKTNKPLNYWLAVPNVKLKTPRPAPQEPFCSACGQPKVWSTKMMDVWTKMTTFDTKGIDIFKSKEWFCIEIVEDRYNKTAKFCKEEGMPIPPWSNYDVEPPPHNQRWTRRMIRRDLYYSLRLEQLLKKLKTKSDLVRYGSYFKDMVINSDDKKWIEEKLEVLAQGGLIDSITKGKAKKSSASHSWFRKYIADNAINDPSDIEFASIEKKYKIKLPQDYILFISKVGNKVFKGINGTTGFVAKILLPKKLDFVSYRKNKLSDNEDGIDGVMFAETQHGDCFLFDVSQKGKDYPVYWYDHEQNALNLFADSFAKCIQRFVEKN